MSDNAPIERTTHLRSPFNGEAWPVPPTVDGVMYAALVKAGFEPIPEKKKAAPPKDKRAE